MSQTINQLTELVEQQNAATLKATYDLKLVLNDYTFTKKLLEYMLTLNLSRYQILFLLKCKDEHLNDLKKIYYGTNNWSKLKSKLMINKRIIDYAKELSDESNNNKVVTWLETL